MLIEVTRQFLNGLDDVKADLRRLLLSRVCVTEEKESKVERRKIRVCPLSPTWAVVALVT